MDENTTNVMGYLEDKIIKLQSQITELQDTIRHYRAVLADTKRTMRVDYAEHDNYQNAHRDENVTL
jgi:hypothetical protein